MNYGNPKTSWACGAFGFGPDDGVRRLDPGGVPLRVGGERGADRSRAFPDDLARRGSRFAGLMTQTPLRKPDRRHKPSGER